ncbi:MAG: histidine phosphatase family protein [Demequina sp.]
MTSGHSQGRSPFAVVGGDLVSPLTMVLVRHGVTDMTETHALSGSGEVGPPLNATGRIQAAKAADAVYRIGRSTWDQVPHVSRVFASPMVRTQETGGAIGRRIGAHVETDPRVREIHFGDWEGLTGNEIAEQFGDAIHRWRFGEIPAPAGESMPQVGERFDEFLVDVAAEHARLCADGDDQARAWAVASHAVAIKSAVGVSLGMPTRHWGHIWPSPASLTLLRLHVHADGTIAERHALCVGAPTD